MVRKAYSFHYSDGPWNIESRFVEDDAIIRFITKSSGLRFDERGAELVLDPDDCCIEEIHVDSHTYTFLCENPSGPVPFAIQCEIEEAIDNAHEDPASMICDDDFVNMLYYMSTRDSDELTAFYDRCVDKAMDNPKDWCDNFPEFWEKVKLMNPGRYQDFLELCKDRGLTFTYRV